LIEFDFKQEKAIAAICYLGSKNISSFDKYKACKLLFFADKAHLAKFARPITGDTYYALQYGPVPSKTLDLMNAIEQGYTIGPFAFDTRYQYPQILAGECDFSVLSKSDIEALDSAAEKYGPKSFAELKAITHELPAYTKADQKTNQMKFEDFFEEDEDAVRGASELANERGNLLKTFRV
jgi:uncharacterized phage-associated protein